MAWKSEKILQVSASQSRRAVQPGTEALALFTTVGDTGGRADALFVLGTIEIFSGKYQSAAALLLDSIDLQRDRGADHTLARHLGGLAAARGDYERAAELAGARDSLREQSGVLLPSVFPAGYARALKAAQAGLTPAAFAAANARLTGQSPSQLVAAAMSGLGSSPPIRP